MIIELAITELVPAKAWFNTAATAAGFVIPGAGLLSFAGKGSVAIEGRVRDGKTGEVLATFADREKDKSAPINLASMSWYQSGKQNVDDWADQIAELLHTPRSHDVTDSSPFTLLPW